MSVIYLVQERLFDAHGVPARQYAHSARHRRLPFLLLQTVGHDEERAQPDAHALGRENDLHRSSDGQQVEHDLAHREVQPFLRDELNDLDEDIKRRVTWHHRLRALGKQRVHDALQSALRGRVALALDPYHVHPQQTVQSLCNAINVTQKIII